MSRGKKYTDDELVQGVYNKDTRVIRYIMDECYPSIEQMVLSNNGNRLDADETFQEALIILYRKIREGNFTLTSSIKTFLYSVSKNRWLQELRRKKNMENISAAFEVEDELDKEIEFLIEKNERLKLFREKFEDLSDKCKKVIQMYLMKVPLAEITKILGYSSEQIARNKRYRCKDELIRIIRKTSTFKELGYENVKRN